MTNLTRGERIALSKLIDAPRLTVGLTITGVPVDFACFGLDAGGKLAGDDYMTFFNQPQTPCGGVQVVQSQGDAQGFAFDLDRLPAAVERIVITASVEGTASLSQLSSGYLRLLGGGNEMARFAFAGTDFASERAAMLGELYRRDGHWRFMAVGQGFDGGLDALVGHFGGDVAAGAPETTPVDLTKRIEQQAPQLVNLVKAAGVTLLKAGLAHHRAKVCLVLDISGSMKGLYKSGLVQSFAERILAMACKFDDDGELDVFLFGRDVHHCQPMGLANWDGYIARAIAKHPLEGDTRYGAAIKAVRGHYFPDAAGGERSVPYTAQLPVYVMFVTDGTTSDKAVAERQLRWASREPIFWQFMGIGKGKKSKNKALADFADSDFPFLEKLGDLDGRHIDNANYFSVASPDEHSDSELYELLMGEYPQWLALARQTALLH